ncbi:hypothetical protein MAE02_62240 [Microvirga aerophila]|uniref:Uncharacterized protein n=1 Tax=Microvirga aerophila TaxID=670291 RepID=A0A512C2T8_9HYPH|nr:hypothetical protein MAE02_62240 [Microvirga aerophila]
MPTTTLWDAALIKEAPSRPVWGTAKIPEIKRSPPPIMFENINTDPRSIANISFAAGFAIRLTAALVTMIIAAGTAGAKSFP